MDFASLSAEWLRRIETKLDSLLPPAETPPERLHAAMRYAVMGGGKRIRPQLVYATGACLDVAPQRLDGPAAAIELMHAFSLVHDDLPAMDDDDLRRGRPTAHKQFDEATAILAADALQPLAFQTLATDADMACKPEVRLRLIDLLAAACGSIGMTGGQSIDLSAEGRQLDEHELRNMYDLKTGRLLHASVLAGAYSAEADADTIAALDAYANNLGLAFQIRDDVLDVEGATEVIGKQQGADIERNKATWPSLFGMETAKRMTDELLDAALEALSPFGVSAEPLRHVGRYIVYREM